MTSFEIGRAFELFILDTYYPKENFDLLHLSSNPMETNRFIESDFMPDICLRERTTQHIFWVECKYRSNSYQKEFPICKPSQLDRFQEIKEPIYFALGLGGTPTSPENVYFLPLKSIRPVMNWVNIRNSKKARPDLMPSNLPIHQRSTHS